MVADDRAPAIDHRLFLAGEHLARHGDRLVVVGGPADGRLQLSQFVERDWRTCGAGRAVIVSLELSAESAVVGSASEIADMVRTILAIFVRTL